MHCIIRLLREIRNIESTKIDSNNLVSKYTQPKYSQFIKNITMRSVENWESWKYFIICTTVFMRFVRAEVNYCPDAKGCECRLLMKNPGFRLLCSNTIDPHLHLIPHENITAITIYKSTFHNMTLMHELRKTKARKISFLHNTFGDNNKTLMDWEWLPSTLANFSITANDFNGFKNKNLTGSRCKLNRFSENMVLHINYESFSGIPPCIPEMTATLILNNLQVENGTRAKIRLPKNISILKLIGSAFTNFSTDFAEAPASLSIIWINSVTLDNGKWPVGLPADSLQKLMFTHSRLSTITPGEMERFKQANKLRQLWLNYNELTDVPQNLPTTIENLQITHNKIQYVTQANWLSLPNLLKLELSNNQLSTVPQKMPSTLQIIHLRDNVIAYSDPDGFSAMKNLKTLDLSYNKLTTMPRGIQPGVEKYLIHHNQISLVQDSGGYDFCTSCNTIRLEGNPWYCNIEMLQMLGWLVNHRISMQPPGYNQEATDSIPHCSKIAIKGIDRLNVALEYMEYFNKPPNDKCSYEIEYLTCRDAGLTDVPDQIPPALTMIRISDNPGLTNIPDDKFSTQNELEKLNFQNNSLQHFPFGLPESTTLLELQDNKLGNWNTKDLIAFQNLTGLRQLYLENNNITVLYAYQFEDLTEMNWIGLSGNQLHCDCAIQSFALWFEKIVPKGSGFVAPSFPICESPPERKGIDIRQNYGYFSYKLQCIPYKCKWHNYPTLNCSAAFLNEDNAFPVEFEPGDAPVIPTNSYWTSLDLSGLKLKTKQIQYSNLTKLTHLNLSDNINTELPLMGLPSSIQVLNLSHNLIEQLPPTQQFKKYLPEIRSLDLSHNNIKHLDSIQVGTLELVHNLQLEGNPFICNCSLRILVEWIHVHEENTAMVQRHQLQALTCRTSEKQNSRTQHIMYLKDEDICPELPLVAIIVSIISVIVIIVILVFAVNLYMQRQRDNRIQEEILLGFQGLLEKENRDAERDPETGMETDKALKFDAFISYDANGADTEFVITLLEELEDKRGYKLCLNERDFMPGAGITDNIVECIGASKRIILILSRTFVSSPWCQYEVQVALAELHHRRKSQLLISLLLEDISIDENLASSVKTFLSLVPSISVPAYTADDDEAWKHFWSELLHMMPTPVNVA